MDNMSLKNVINLISAIDKIMVINCDDSIIYDGSCGDFRATCKDAYKCLDVKVYSIYTKNNKIIIHLTDMKEIKIPLFNETELSIISDSLISAIENCNKAYNLVNDVDSLRAIDKERHNLSLLNERVCKINMDLYGAEV